MAQAQEVHDAVERLADMFEGVDHSTRGKIPDSTVSVTVRDLDLVYGCRFEAGEVRDVTEIDADRARAATLRITTDSDTLLDVVDGRVHFGHAWATGKVRVDAKIRDLLKLRSFL